MTENSWPQDGTFESPATAGQIPAPPVSTTPPIQTPVVPGSPAPAADSTSDVAKTEATDVAHEATDAVQNVAETTKTEAAHVADEVKTNARELFAQAKNDLTDQAGTQQQKLTEGLRSVSTELHAMVSSSEQPGLATDLVRQAAERSSAVASWLEGRDSAALLAEVASYARRKPGTFLLLAAGAGILAGRLTRSLSAGASDQGASRKSGAVTPVAATGAVVPPVPVELPTTDITAGGLPGTYPADPLGSESLTGAGRKELWAQEPVVTDPLPPVGTDPLGQEPFDGGRQ